MKRKHPFAAVAGTLLSFVLAGHSAAFDFPSNNEAWRTLGLYDDGGLTPVPGWFSDDPAGWFALWGSPGLGALILGSGGFTFPPSPTGSPFLHWDLNSPDVSGTASWQGISSFSYNITGDEIATTAAIYVEAVLRVRKPDNTISYFTDNIFHEIPTAPSGSWDTHTVNVAALGMPAGTTILNVNLRIFFEPSSGHDGYVAVDHVVPTGVSKTCQGHCGGQGVGGCYCDSACHDFGDCCPDKCDFCPAPQCPGQGGCQGHCGGQSPDGCYCDANCKQYGDCCPDYDGRCGPHACSPPGVCGNYQSCGLNCSCGAVAEGGGVCGAGGTPCSGLTACSGSNGCPSGYVCLVDTCCPTPNVCVPFCGAAAAAADGQVWDDHGQATARE